MSSIMIVNLDGTKTPTTREQLIQMAKSGVLMPDAKVDVLGRIVPARKIQDLIPIFEERERQAIESGINASSGLSVDESPTSFPIPPINNVASENSSPSYEGSPEDSPRKNTDSNSTSANPKTLSMEERALIRAGDALDPLISLCGFIRIVGVITAVVGFIGGFFTYGVSIIGAIISCMLLYFLYGFVRIIIYYVLRRNQDSIRQEDFNHDVMRQLNEIKERLGQE